MFGSVNTFLPVKKRYFFNINLNFSPFLWKTKPIIHKAYFKIKTTFKKSEIK